jgi:protein-disulfide isomerase
MENSSDKESTQGRFVGVNLYILGFALIATLITGVAIGLLIDRSTQSVQVVVTATPNPNSRPVARANEQQSQTSAQSNSAATTTSSGDDTTAAGPPTPTIMDFVLSDARHFQGDPNAPVTLIELSDFK